jgi:hypothetical protein
MRRECRSLPPSGHVSGEQIFALLLKHFERGEHNPERRTSERQPWSIGLTVWFEDPYSPLPSIREIEAATLNVSRGGLSFLAERFIQEGSQIRVRFNAIPGAPVVAGFTRSCEHFGGAWHCVGVEFVAPTASF